MMKKALLVLLIILSLAPTFLWLKNAGTHQPGTEKWQQDKAVQSHYARVSAAAYPVLHQDQLWLVSISDAYIYQFAMEEQPRFVKRYDIGGKAKSLIIQPEGLIVATQENRLRNQWIQLNRLDFATGELTKLIEPAPVTGEMAHNLMLSNGWLYTWGLYDGEIELIWTDGDRLGRERLELSDQTEVQRGYNLSLPKINLPIFEVGDKAYLLGPEGVEQTAETARDLVAVSDEAYHKLSSDEYMHFYFHPEVVIARQKQKTDQIEEIMTQWTTTRDMIEELEQFDQTGEVKTYPSDVLSLPDLTRVSQLMTPGFIYPQHLMATAEADFDRYQSAVSAQTKVVDFYHNGLTQTEQAIDDYLASSQLGDFLRTPTSIGLIIAQFVSFFIGWQVLSKEDPNA